jgi:hypothetical protein
MVQDRETVIRPNQVTDLHYPETTDGGMEERRTSYMVTFILKIIQN